MLGDLSSNKAKAQAQALQMAEKNRISMAKPYQPELNQGNSTTLVEHHYTPSIGAVLINNLTIDKETILKKADAAMYQVKEKGRNQIYFQPLDAV